MGRIEKTIFLSYRRTNVPWAIAISQNLTHHGYDVFFDFNGIASGDFERVIGTTEVSSERLSVCSRLKHYSEWFQAIHP